MTKPEATPKPLSRREQSIVLYYQTRRDKLLAKRDAITAEIDDIDKKLLPFLPEA